MMGKTCEISVQHLPSDVLTAVWLGERCGVIAVTSPLFDSAARLVHVSEKQEHTLWEGVTGVTPRLLRLGDDLALCHFPGQSLFAVRQVDGAVTCTELTAQGDVATPELIQQGQGGLLCVSAAASGKNLSGLALSESTFTLNGPAHPLPDMAPDSRVSALADLGDAGYLLLADNMRTGFEGWHLDAQGNWTAVIRRGHWRDGFNGAVTAVLAQNSRMLVGTGLAPLAEQSLFGLPASPELLTLLPPGQPCQVITGETRVGPDGLILPLAGPAAPTGGVSGRIAALTCVQGVMHVAMQTRDAGAMILAMDENCHLTRIGQIDGQVVDMRPTGASGGLKVLTR